MLLISETIPAMEPPRCLGEESERRRALIETLRRMGFYDPEALLESLADRRPAQALPKRVPRALRQP